MSGCLSCGAVVFTCDLPLWQMWLVQVPVAVASVWHWAWCRGDIGTDGPASGLPTDHDCGMDCFHRSHFLYLTDDQYKDALEAEIAWWARGDIGTGAEPPGTRYTCGMDGDDGEGR